jgi:hypothetical protein
MRYLSILLILPAAVLAASSSGLTFEEGGSVSSDVWSRIDESGLLESYSLSPHLNPFYLQGDFDGDSRLDTALLIRSRSSGKAGIAILQSTSKSPILLGADHPLPGNRGDNLDFMGAWYVKPKGPVSSVHEPGPPPTLRGDAILVAKLEASSALLYWNGTAYDWYQQAD